MCLCIHIYMYTHIQFMYEQGFIHTYTYKWKEDVYAFKKLLYCPAILWEGCIAPDISFRTRVNSMTCNTAWFMLNTVIKVLTMQRTKIFLFL